MKKINTLKSNEDFNRIINNFKPYKYKDYILYIEWTKENSYYFGLSVGKKIGNAVLRNKYKRRLKNIIDKKHYKNGFNCIIILRNSVLNSKYADMEKNLLEVFEKLKLIKEN